MTATKEMIDLNELALRWVCNGEHDAYSHLVIMIHDTNVRNTTVARAVWLAGILKDAIPLDYDVRTEPSISILNGEEYTGMLGVDMQIVPKAGLKPKAMERIAAQLASAGFQTQLPLTFN